MQYEDLKDVFYFKAAEGTSVGIFKAQRVNKHTWRISCDLDVHSSFWDCDDILYHLIDGTWVIQGEEGVTEQKQQETVVEVKTLRDEFAMVALQGWLAGQPKIGGQSLDGTEGHAKLIAEVAYRYANAMMKARKESL